MYMGIVRDFLGVLGWKVVISLGRRDPSVFLNKKNPKGLSSTNEGTQA